MSSAAGDVSASPASSPAAFQGQRAGVVTRSIAAVIDAVVVAALIGAVWVTWCAVSFIFHPASFTPPSPPPGLAGSAYSLVAVGYLTAAWALSGRTPGAQLMGLRVISRRGGRVGWLQAWGRALLCAIVPIGLLWSAVSPQRRALHDIALRTDVVYDWIPH
jgi:uncharacterized RDD family membrane protein YckC